MKAILVAPPWDVADMMAVMKKDMSATLHSNAQLSRCHLRLAATVKAREGPTSLSLAADLASNVSSVLLMLPLPAKTDKGEVLALFRYCIEACKLGSLAGSSWATISHQHALSAWSALKLHVLGTEHSINLAQVRNQRPALTLVAKCVCQ